MVFVNFLVAFRISDSEKVDLELLEILTCLILWHVMCMYMCVSCVAISLGYYCMYIALDIGIDNFMQLSNVLLLYELNYLQYNHDLIGVLAGICPNMAVLLFVRLDD